MSNGYTEDSIAVFSENNIKSVSSPWDNESLNKFKVSTTYSIDKLKELLPEETLTPQEEREIKKISQELNYQKLNSLLKNKRR